jgi:hypothetical protein
MNFRKDDDRFSSETRLSSRSAPAAASVCQMNDLSLARYLPRQKPQLPSKNSKSPQNLKTQNLGEPDLVRSGRAIKVAACQFDNLKSI